MRRVLRIFSLNVWIHVFVIVEHGLNILFRTGNLRVTPQEFGINIDVVGFSADGYVMPRAILSDVAVE